MQIAKLNKYGRQFASYNHNGSCTFGRRTHTHTHTAQMKKKKKLWVYIAQNSEKKRP